jgi:co-chaperonin GroES (HSP10)
MTVIPVNGGILVEPFKMKRGAIIIPDGATRKEPTTGKVIAISDEYVYDGVVRKVFVNVGDIIVYAPREALTFEVDGKEMTLVYINRVIAIIEDIESTGTKEVISKFVEN